ncbi:Transcription elongation factor TFIIS [Striga hermonthica]|uniref:Transcription elongation factor n=1 Tax=Striga hermonthica TaxID=68872 RepID=A0A9N7MF39_STRHE|nr:Transcription elongation factor TFIIS [Striga hermonthica]
MEKELSELFESVKRAADAAENSPGEEDRCIDALKQLKKFPVNYEVLVSTKVGKHLRQLTKHRSDRIKTLATDVVGIWKGIIVKETSTAKKNGVTDLTETNNTKNLHRTNSIKAEQSSSAKKLQIEKTTTTTSTYNAHSSTSTIKTETKVKVEKSNVAAAPPKLTSLVYCKDEPRDRIRELLAEALCKVPGEVEHDSSLGDRVGRCDPYRVAVMVETAMFDKWGSSKGAQKHRYRSIMFNIKDNNNPDFRRKVLVGEFEPRAVPDLTPEQMASDERRVENEKLKQKALFNSERAAAPKASTNEFTCGRCKKKETTYYQMQTRSADEPMTTFVTCVNCGNHWKFC